MRAFLRSTFATLTMTGLLFAAAACGTDTETETVVEDSYPGEFADDSGQARPGSAELAYPPGPYGFGFGSVVPSYEFIGYINPEIESVAEPPLVQRIRLAEFYNPSGDGVYPEGSVFPVGTPKPKALLLGVSAIWCGPCNSEASTVLPGKYTQLKPLGAEFLINLSQDGSFNPTKQIHLGIWAGQYIVEYPLVVDPTEKLMAHASDPAFPTNIIVDARTMKVIHADAGVPIASFWTLFQQVIDGTHVTPEY